MRYFSGAALQIADIILAGSEAETGKVFRHATNRYYTMLVTEVSSRLSRRSVRSEFSRAPQ